MLDQFDRLRVARRALPRARFRTLARIVRTRVRLSILSVAHLAHMLIYNARIRVNLPVHGGGGCRIRALEQKLHLPLIGHRQFLLLASFGNLDLMHFGMGLVSVFDVLAGDHSIVRHSVGMHSLAHHCRHLVSFHVAVSRVFDKSPKRLRLHPRNASLQFAILIFEQFVSFGHVGELSFEREHFRLFAIARRLRRLAILQLFAQLPICNVVVAFSVCDRVDDWLVWIGRRVARLVVERFGRGELVREFRVRVRTRRCRRRDRRRNFRQADGWNRPRNPRREVDFRHQHARYFRGLVGRMTLYYVRNFCLLQILMPGDEMLIVDQLVTILHPPT